MQISAKLFRFNQVLNQIWVKVVAYSLLAVFTALAAVGLRPFIPSHLNFSLGAEAVETVLTIVATSMLTVSTFSLGIMATAISGAANGATPRATALLLDDRTSQNVLATFLGAFLYALVSIIALQMGIYQDSGRVILMGVTILVIVLIYISFIRWINLLRSFGRIPDTLERVENCVRQSLKARLTNPYLGCKPWAGESDKSLRQIPTPRIGYVQHIDTENLQKLAQKYDLRLILSRMPGQFACAERPLMLLRPDSADVPKDVMRALTACFTLGNGRTFSQDPQFGMIVLAETACRALSPAVNDPGTAIDVLRRALRILSRWEHRAEPEVKYNRLWIAGLQGGDFLRDLIRPIARDGASNVEVQHIIQSVLCDLARTQQEVFGAAALAASQNALAHAEHGLVLESDRQEIRDLAACLPAIDEQPKEAI